MAVHASKSLRQTILLAALVFAISFSAHAQNEVAIGSATTKSNAILWLNGNGSQGLILPVVTNKTAVASPDKGMIVYDNSDNKVWYRNDNAWVEVGGSGPSASTLNLQIQNNLLRLRDGATVLSEISIAAGTQATGSFLVFQGGAWQYGQLSGDVNGLNGALQVTGLRGKALATLPASAQALIYDPAANSGAGGWVFQSVTLPVLANGQILTGNGTTNSATTLSGDATLSGGTLTIGNNAITTAKLNANAVDGTKLADNAVTSAKITDATITGADIANATITANKLAQSGATNNQVLQWNGTAWVPASVAAAGGVTQIDTGTGLAGGPITSTGTISIASNGVGTTQLADNAVVTNKLADNAVTTTKIVNNAVDNTKLADNAITSVKITDGTITGADIAATTITADKLAQSAATSGQVLKWNGTNWGPQNDDTGVGTTPTLSNGQILTGNGTTNSASTLTGDATLSGGTLTIAASAINSAKIADGSIAATDLAAGSVTGGTGGIISDGTITNADISNTAAIAGSKITPVFGAQNISTTGTLSAGATTVTGLTIGTSVWPANASGALTNNGSGTLSWAPSFTNPMTTQGDIIYGGASGVATRLATGTGFLKGGTTPSYSAVNLAGADVTGVLGVANGGTGLSTFGGGLLYASGPTTIGDISNGTTGQVLKMVGTTPGWQNFSVASADILDGTIVDADVATAAAIAGSKINPNFSAQNVTTTGVGTFGQLNITSSTTNTAETISLSTAGATANQGIRVNVGGSTNTNYGVYPYVGGGATSYGVHAFSESSSSAGYGVYGRAFGTSPTAYGVFGDAGGPGTNYGIYGSATGGTTNWAGYFVGNTAITGGLAVGATPNFGTSGQVLTSAGPSLPPTWSNASGGSGWSLTGNAGTVDGTNFIGTTDNVPLSFKVNNLKAGRIDPALQNVFFGLEAGNAVSSGNLNSAYGHRALSNNTTGYSNTALGSGALEANSTGINNTSIGANALPTNNGDLNTAVGVSTMLSNTTGANNTALGYIALGLNATGNKNTAVGTEALYSQTTASSNSAFGANALRATTGGFNTGIGYNAGKTNAAGSNNTFLGVDADASAGNLTNATAIGANAIVTANNSIQLGDANVTTVNVGTATNAKLVTGALQVTGGTIASGSVLTSDAAGNATWQAAGGGWGLTGNAGTVDGTNFIGTTDNIPLNFRVNNEKSGRIDPTAAANTFLGYQSGNVTTGNENTGFGFRSLLGNTSGNFNAAFGFRALVSNTTGSRNTAVGNSALVSNTTGTDNTAVGTQALSSNTGGFNSAMGGGALLSNTTGVNNTGVGYYALVDNTTGSLNTAVGLLAGRTNTIANTNTTGSRNTFLGYASGPGTTTQLNNATAIGANAVVTQNNSLVLGSINGVNGATSNTNVGIGTTAPATTLDISGNTLIRGTNTNTAPTVSSGLELMTGRSNAGGLITGQSSADIAFNWGGASGGYRHFIQTRHNSIANSNSNAIDFYINNSTTATGSITPNNTTPNGNVLGMSITATGVGIGTASPNANTKLHISGAGTQYLRVEGTGTLASGGIQLDGNGTVDWSIIPQLGILSFNLGDVNGTMNNMYLMNSGYFTPANSTNPNPTLGQSTQRWGTIYTTVTVNVSSDRRLKNNIHNLNYGLNEILQLRPVSYSLKTDKTNNTYLGLIAQEVKAIIPEIVEGNETDGEYLSIRYTEMIPVLTKALQEQQNQIEELKKKLSEKEEKVSEMESSISSMNQELENIKRTLGIEAKSKDVNKVKMK